MLAPDAFLSGALGAEAFRLAYSPELGEILGDSGSELRRALAAAGKRGLVSAKVPVTDLVCAARLQDLEFRLVDTNVQLERARAGTGAGTAVPAGYAIDAAAPGDRAGVAKLAGQGFRYSRFHLDPRIPREVADRLKARWAENYFRGERGDAMVVARRGDEVAGFLLLLDSGPDLVIDLVAVAPDHQRRDLAAAMIGRAAAARPGSGRLVVGTQVANTPSLRLYEKLGFRICSASYALHRHP